jgi:hypothetical protein
MWNNLPFLEALRLKLDVAAAVLTFLAAILIVLSRWPLARRIATLQAYEKTNLQTRLQTAEEATSRLTGQLGEAQQKREVVEKELREQLGAARERAGEAAAQAARLTEAAKPRTLASEQTTRLRDSLAPCAGATVAFEVPAGAAEALNLASQLAAVFAAAGWHTSDTIQAVYKGTPQGIILLIGSIEAPHPCALRVQQAFEAIGLEAPAEVKPGLDLKTLRIIVGYKPGSAGLPGAS